MRMNDEKSFIEVMLMFFVIQARFYKHSCSNLTFRGVIWLLQFKFMCPSLSFFLFTTKFWLFVGFVYEVEFRLCVSI